MPHKPLKRSITPLPVRILVPLFWLCLIYSIGQVLTHCFFISLLREESADD